MIRQTDPARQVAIIGAGIAGLAAARRLGQAGFGVTLFDKSRGLGGRMATRRVDDLQFDHGAQYFTVRGERFGALVDEWLAEGIVAQWGEGCFVGMPGMTAPARHLAGGHSVVTACEVVGLLKGERGWAVETAEGLVETQGNGHFAAVLMAVPAPQARPLAASAGVALPGLDKAVYEPCWALMLAFSQPVSLPADRMKPQDDTIAWIARNASKPGRRDDRETIVIHATPGWSRRHLEWKPQQAAAELLACFVRLTGIDAQPSFAAAHRWRYAFVETPVGDPCLWDADATFGACGDWCIGPRVEAAFDSGEALANAAIATLEAPDVS